MKIIVGLGNPGEKYAHSRHNLGFRVLEALAEDLKLTFVRENKFFSEIARTDEVLLARPQTFMNESGRAVLAMKKFYKLSNQDLLIVQDEIDLPLGTIRYAKNSGSAGHLGIASIIGTLGQDILRLRIGIEHRKSREEIPTDDYVMQNFTEEEEAIIQEQIIPQAIAEIKKLSRK